MPKNKFNASEKVLCYHGPLIYEAKVLKHEFAEKTFNYLVHYAGWSKTWDEWVPEDRVLKFTEENIQTMKNMKATYEASQSKSKKPGKSKGKSESTPVTPSVPATVTSSEAPGSRSSTPNVEKATTKSRDSIASPITTPVSVKASSSSSSSRNKRTRASVVSEAVKPAVIETPPIPKEVKALSSTSGSSAQKPAKSSSSTPGTSAQKQAKSSSSTPGTTAQKPAKSSSSTPGTSTQKQAKTSSTPGTSAQKPAKSSSSTPGTSAQKPAKSSSSTPGTSVQKPAKSSSSTPGTSAQKPAKSSSSTPGTSAQKPAKSSSSTPGTSSQKHAKTSSSTSGSSSQKQAKSAPSTSTATSVAIKEEILPTPSTSSMLPIPYVPMTIKKEKSLVKRLDTSVIKSENLKQYIAEDWFRLNKQQKLYTLPAKITIEDIFQQYEKEMGIVEFDTPKAIVIMLRAFVNDLCHIELLYLLEHKQYQEFKQRHSKKDSVEIYGVQHLLRLLVNLPQYLRRAKIGTAYSRKLLSDIKVIVAYLDANIARFVD